MQYSNCNHITGSGVAEVDAQQKPRIETVIVSSVSVSQFFQ
jgi:hypothetical protein